MRRIIIMSIILLAAAAMCRAQRANCFIVNPSKPFSFKPSNVGLFWGGNGYEKSSDNIIGSGDRWTAEVLWHELASGEVRLDKDTGTGPDDMVTVSFTDRNTRGNVLVAVKKGETILWSWHLWVTGDAIREVSVGGTTWMDRDLGECRGVSVPVYQFGRKDPFPENGVTPVEVTEMGCGGSDVPFSVSNPTTFIFSSRGYFYWVFNDRYNPGPEATGKSRMHWQDPRTARGQRSEGGRSMFDPCPAGWRLPLKSELDTLVKMCPSWDRGKNALVVEDTETGDLLTFPARSRRDPQSGGVTEEYDGGGARWSATESGYEFGYKFVAGGKYVGTCVDTRTTGLSVRCVRN